MGYFAFSSIRSSEFEKDAPITVSLQGLWQTPVDYLMTLITIEHYEEIVASYEIAMNEDETTTTKLWGAWNEQLEIEIPATLVIPENQFTVNIEGLDAAHSPLFHLQAQVLFL